MNPLFERLLLWFSDDVIAGDLLEEYREERLPRMGRLRAELWYLRQVVSIAARRVPGALAVLSLLSVGCAVWLATMELVLKHSGCPLRTVEDVGLAMQASAAMVAVATARARTLRWMVAAASVAVACDAVASFVHNARAQHFEGFVVVIAPLLLTQSLLTLAALRRRDHRSKSSS